jgi:hypothetical protein
MIVEWLCPENCALIDCYFARGGSLIGISSLP